MHSYAVVPPVCTACVYRVCVPCVQQEEDKKMRSYAVVPPVCTACVYRLCVPCVCTVCVYRVCVPCVCTVCVYRVCNRRTRRCAATRWCRLCVPPVCTACVYRVCVPCVQQEEDKKMRSYAVVPPLLLDARQRLLKLHNNNGLTEEPMMEYKDGQLLNVWSAREKAVFRDKYLQHPKNFSCIATFLERKVRAASSPSVVRGVSGERGAGGGVPRV